MTIIAPEDYGEVSLIVTLDNTTTNVVIINISDDILCEADEMFELMLSSLSDSCAVSRFPVPVHILDNDSMSIQLFYALY